MAISPQVILFVLFMLAVVEATRLDEKRQRRRDGVSDGKDRKAPTRSS